MPKRLNEYTTEDFLVAAQRARATMFWDWVAASEEIVGLENTIKILESLGAASNKERANYWLAYWSVDKMDTALVAETANILHKQVGTVAPWTIISPKEGYETVTRCYLSELAPEKYKNKGIPIARCSVGSKALYENLIPGVKVEMTGGLCKGAKFCRFYIKPM